MFRSDKKSLSLVLPLALLGLTLGLGFSTRSLKADIITDIEELEKEKDPNKKPEKKKDKPKATEEAGTVPKDTIGGSKKPVTPKVVPPPAQMENPDPETQALIPEPIEESMSAPIPPKAPIGKPIKGGKSKEQRKKAPIHLASDGTSTYSQDRLTVVLQKNVMITQDDLRLQADEAKVTFLPKNADNSGVKTAVLDGKVSISRYSTDPTERMNAKSDKATFDNVQQQVTLDGNARLWQSGNLVKGERIVYDLTSGMVKIEKAQGVVQPDRMKK